jgi:hypothetical protein
MTELGGEDRRQAARNVLGEALEICSIKADDSI